MRQGLTKSWKNFLVEKKIFGIIYDKTNELFTRQFFKNSHISNSCDLYLFFFI